MFFKFQTDPKAQQKKTALDREREREVVRAVVFVGKERVGEEGNKKGEGREGQGGDGEREVWGPWGSYMKRTWTLF